MKTETPGYAARHLRHQLPRVCVALCAPNAAEMMARIEAAAQDNSLLELRLDHMSQPLPLLAKLRHFASYHRDILFIATCRRAAAGGKFRGSIASELAVLKKAIAAGCQLIDLDISSAKTLKGNELEKIRQQAGLIISAHDYRATKKLDELWDEMHRLEPDFIKMVSTARSLSDNVKMLRLLQEKNDTVSTVGLCMGEQGVVSRILTVRSPGRSRHERCATSIESTASMQRQKSMASPDTRSLTRSRRR
jgi:3-dehydroquinate dehydratase/shikimate dehydrogenase